MHEVYNPANFQPCRSWTFDQQTRFSYLSYVWRTARAIDTVRAGFAATAAYRDFTPELFVPCAASTNFKGTPLEFKRQLFEQLDLVLTDWDPPPPLEQPPPFQPRAAQRSWQPRAALPAMGLSLDGTPGPLPTFDRPARGEMPPLCNPPLGRPPGFSNDRQVAEYQPPARDRGRDNRPRHNRGQGRAQQGRDTQRPKQRRSRSPQDVRQTESAKRPASRAAEARASKRQSPRRVVAPPPRTTQGPAAAASVTAQPISAVPLTALPAVTASPAVTAPPAVAAPPASAAPAAVTATPAAAVLAPVVTAPLSAAPAASVPPPAEHGQQETFCTVPQALLQLLQDKARGFDLLSNIDLMKEAEARSARSKASAAIDEPAVASVAPSMEETTTVANNSA